jgi:hypothetical protein
MTDTEHVTDTSTRIVTAIEQTWSEIRRRHPDVPDVVTTLASGTAGQRTSEKYGHFATGRWARGDSPIPELFVGGEGLRRGARPVLGTLIHEAAHGAAHTRGIQDTSRQARWHNSEFRRIGEEFGLSLAKDPRIGWSVTTVPDGTAAAYAEQLEVLGAALTVHRQAETTPRARRPNANNGRTLACRCGRRIRASVAVADAGPILCGLCGGMFESQG